jgi:hypothetical protein
MSIPRVSARGRHGIDGVGFLPLNCDQSVQLRQYVATMWPNCGQKPIPATPMRPLADGGGVGFFFLNKQPVSMLLGDYHV